MRLTFLSTKTFASKYQALITRSCNRFLILSARKWWWSLGTRTKRVAILNASGSWTDTCEYTFYEACPILGSSCPWLRGTDNGHGSAHGVGHGSTRGGGHVSTHTHGLKDWSTFGQQQQRQWW